MGPAVEPPASGAVTPGGGVIGSATRWTSRVDPPGAASDAIFSPSERSGWRQTVLGVALVAAGGAAAAWLLDAPSAMLATGWAVAVAIVVRSDLERFIIPDAASVGIAGLAVLQAAALSWREGTSVASALQEVLSNGAVAFACFWVLARGYRWRTGREGLGFGDVKLAGASGLWLTLPQQVIVLELACVVAIVAVLVLSRGVALRRAAIPFGAFLAPSAWLVFVAGPAVGAALPPF